MMTFSGKSTNVVEFNAIMNNLQISGVKNENVLLSCIFLFSLTFNFRFRSTTPTPTPPEDKDDSIKISTTLIQIDVTVTDKDGNIVTDLKPEDFEVFENGKKQDITNFSFIRRYRKTTTVETTKSANCQTR